MPPPTRGKSRLLEAQYVGVGVGKWISVGGQSPGVVSEDLGRQFEMLQDGTIYDKNESKVLVLSVQGTIKDFFLDETNQIIVVLNRVVSSYIMSPDGKIIGARFSGADELTFLQLTGGIVRRVPLDDVGEQFLDREGDLIIPLIYSNYLIEWANPLNWLRALAGHPKQLQKTMVSILDLSGGKIESLLLGEGHDLGQFRVFKVVQ